VKNKAISAQPFQTWAFSNLLSNTTRGIFAEYLVKEALNITSERRTEWNAWDLVSNRDQRIEVKSAAYIQSWAQTKPSTIQFNIAPTKGWDASTNTSISEKKRLADVYVFCVLQEHVKLSEEVLNTNNWTFYVLPTKVLDEKKPLQASIRLKPLLALQPVICNYSEMKAAVEAFAD